MTRTRRLIPAKRDGRPVIISAVGTSRVDGKLGRCSCCDAAVALVQSPKTGRWYMAAVQHNAFGTPRVMPWLIHECKDDEVARHAEESAAIEAHYADKQVPADPGRQDLGVAFMVLDNEGSGPNAVAWAEATIKATGMNKSTARRLAGNRTY